VATVVSRTAWLDDDDAAGHRAVEVSFGTRLPVLGTTDALVRVGLPGGRVLRASAQQVSVTGSGDPALPPDGAALVRSARVFIGLPYLWAGRSGFGVDCSGLTSLVYRVHGVVIPRDAAPQADAGISVPSHALHSGDLLFYARDGQVHHVSMYAGGGHMVHARRRATPSSRSQSARRPSPVNSRGPAASSPEGRPLHDLVGRNHVRHAPGLKKPATGSPGAGAPRPSLALSRAARSRTWQGAVRLIV
jgi:cell wall-associated NlpC family hydrolase